MKLFTLIHRLCLISQGRSVGCRFLRNPGFILSLAILIALSFKSLAQPTVLYTNLSSTTPASTNNRWTLNTPSIFKQFRFQANQSGNFYWAFSMGTPATPDYSSCWRPYTSGNAMLYNTFIPTSWADGAKYNTSNGGSDGELNNIQNGYYYTFNVGINAAADNVMEVLETSYNPTLISSCTSAWGTYGQRIVTVVLASAPQPGENVFVRYTTGGINFPSSSYAQLSMAGNTGTFTIPAQAVGSTVHYYAFTSNRSKAAIDSDVASNGQSAYDMASLTISGTPASYTMPAGPVVVTSTGGTLAGTPTSYTTLQLAFAAINGGAQHTGNVSVAILGNTTETVTATLNQVAAVTSVGIQPAGGASRVVSGIIGGALITFSGADNVTIDGREGGTGSTRMLTFANNSAANNASTILLSGDATNNTIQYCTINGSNTSSSGAPYGTIMLTTGTGTGNDNNTFSYNDIGNAGGTPSFAIYSYTANATYSNDNIVVSNNDIHDYFSTSTDAAGIFLNAGAGITSNSSWTISNNKFYQSVARTTAISGNSYRAIRIGNTSTSVAGIGFSIVNNTIGFGTNSGTGTTTYGPVTPNQGYRFIAIQLFVGTATPSSVQGNTISNIALSSTSGAATAPGIFSGISVEAGAVNVGTTSGNIIGASSGSGLISATSSAALPGIFGICCTSPSIVNIQNNQIGGFTVANSNTTLASNFYGIYKSASAGTTSITNNLIGSNSTAGSITSSSISTTNAQALYGIYSAGSGTSMISGNTINNLVNSTTNTTVGVLGLINGITTMDGVNTITGNTIQNLSIGNANNTAVNTASIIGINQASTQSGQTITGNTISGLSNTYATFAGYLHGIYYSGSTAGTNSVSANFVYGMTAGSANATLTGIRINSGVTTYANNVINLGTGYTSGCNVIGIYDAGTATNTCKIYFNTVYLSGNISSGHNSYALYSNASSNTRDYRNNIFMNAHNRTASNSKHYAAYFNYNVNTNLTLDYNDYYAPNTNGILGFWNGADRLTLPIVTGRDAFSLNLNPSFTTPGGNVPANYMPTISTLQGVAGTGIGIDFAGTSRCFPTMGAFEKPVPPLQPSIITGNSNPCAGSSQSYSVTSVTGVVYNWSLPSGWSQTGGGTTNAITVTVGNTSGTITVTPSDACGNAGPSRTLSVTVNTVPAQPVAISGVTNPCWGTAQIYSVPSVAGESYAWVLPSGWVQTSGGNTNTIGVTVGQNAGTISVTPSNTCGNGPAQTLAVTVSSLSVSVSPVNTSFCPGGSVVLNGSGASSYSWSPAAGLSATTGNTVTATPAATTTYTVTGTDASGCKGSAAALVTVYPLPSATTIANTQIYRGSSISIGGASTAGHTYNWTSAPAGFTSSSSNPSVAPLVNTTYTLVETDQVTGCTNTHSVTITVIDNLSITKSISSFPAFMPGDPIQYTIIFVNNNENGTPALNVEIKDYLPAASLFTFQSASIAPSSNAGNVLTWNSSTVPWLASLAVGTYSITIDGICGSLGNPNWPAYDPASYYIMNGGGTQTISNNASISNSSMAMPVYIPAPESMDVDQYCSPILMPDTVNGFIKSSTPSFIYYVFTIYNDGNITDNFLLNVNANVAPSLVNLTFTVETLAGVPITQTGWMLPGESKTFMVRVDCPGGTNPNLGNKSILIATSTVCGNTDQSVMLTNTYGGQITGDECNLQITKTSSANPVTVGNTFTYNLAVSTAGDPASNVIILDTLPASLTYISSSYTTSVAGAIVNLSYNALTHVLTGIYQKSPKNQLNNGEYFNVTITVQANCASAPAVTNRAVVTTSTEDSDYSNNSTSVTTAILSNINPPTVSPTAPLICSGQTVTITASSAGAGYGYKWYDALTGGTLLFTGSTFTTPVLLTTTPYFAAIYNLADPTCESSRTQVIVTVYSVPVVQANPVSIAVCENGTATFSITATGTPPVTFKWQVNTGSGFTDIVNGGVYSGATTSTLTITGALVSMSGFSYRCLVQSGTCGYLTASAAAILTVNANPTVVVNNASRCANDPAITITATPSPSGTYNYSWTVPAGATNPGNVASFNATIAGAYSVTITNPITGCSGSGTGVLTVNPNPVTSPIYHL